MTKRRNIGIATATALLAALTSPASGIATASPDCQGDHWVGAWAASPSNAAEPGFVDQSLRLIVTPTYGGHRVRVRLSNRLGSDSVTFASAFVARRRSGADLVPGTSRRLRFGARPAVTMAPGREVVSDPVELRFRAFQDLALSVHVQGSAGAASQHFLAFQTSYSAAQGGGDHAGETAGASFTGTMGSWPYLTDVEVRAPRSTGAVVALGDSITEGFPGDTDRNARYPDFLARRLASHGRAGSAVQNAGISSNRLVGDFPSPFAGPSALHRLRRDVLDQAGVSDVIVLEGTNDIGQPPPARAARAGQVIAATRRLVRRLHRAGLRVILGTQTPSTGYPLGLHGTPAVIAKRNRINRWIRRQGIASGVVDFHAALRDPSDRDRLRPAYDSGDHLHPNAAGYRAMARAVPLRLLGGPGCARGPRDDRVPRGEHSSGLRRVQRRRHRSRARPARRGDRAGSGVAVDHTVFHLWTLVEERAVRFDVYLDRAPALAALRSG